MKTLNIQTILALAVSFLLANAPSALACVGCREPGAGTIAHEPQTVASGVAFSWSVLFMLVVVLSIIAGMTLFIWRSCVSIERERAAQ